MEAWATWLIAVAKANGLSPEVIARLKSLVLVTKHTATPVAPDEQLLVDIDLSILGASSERFAEYEQQIRDEYSFVPYDVFIQKRQEILKGFLDRPRIYQTAYCYDLLERNAITNLLLAIG